MSTLSRLESGQRQPNLELLLPLARAHGVPLDELVGAPATGDPRIHLHPINGHGMTIVPLSRGASGIQAFKHVIPAAGEAAEFDTRTPRWSGRAVAGEVEFLSLYGPQGERMHVRERPADK